MKLLSEMVGRKIAITSPKGGRGKTTVAVNLAVTFAMAGITTYLVDADTMNMRTIESCFRLIEVNSTLSNLLRQRALVPMVSTEIPSAVLSGDTILDAFTTIDALPTLKVLPRLITFSFVDTLLQNEEIIESTIAGLYEAGVASGGVVIMDVGDPSHPLHRAALRHAEEVVMVIKPEIADIDEVQGWISRMLGPLAKVTGRRTAIEFIGSKVKFCFNMVVGDVKAFPRLSLKATEEDELDSIYLPSGVLPLVDYDLANRAVSMGCPQDILIWRYEESKLEELAPFADALSELASHL